MSRLRAFVEGIGLRGPGLDGWEPSRPVLTGAASYVPEPTNMAVTGMLPPNERRRAGIPIKLAIASGHEAFEHAQRSAADTATVFTSSSGDNENVHAICETLVTAPREVSPTRFHNSVHNAVAGYWGIAAQSHAPSTSLCGYDSSFAVGLLDAMAQLATDGIPVALLAYDHAYREPLASVRHVEGNFGIALVLTPRRTERCFAVLELEFQSGAAHAAPMADPALERLRLGNPAARSLPLLEALAGVDLARAARQPGLESRLALDYQGDCRLDMTVTPC
ncbi:MAG TPA: beta-ketoacyl synthase chain length factor [Gallionellaceae bacterium]|nr:beta-ketoacyl synthase chain length factor [Gallionellaceae bacterium]